MLDSRPFYMRSLLILVVALLPSLCRGETVRPSEFKNIPHAPLTLAPNAANVIFTPACRGLCQNLSALAQKFNCVKIEPESKFSGALSPSLAVATCHMGAGAYSPGVNRLHNKNLGYIVIDSKGQPNLVTSWQELLKFFKPPSDEYQALAFMLSFSTAYAGEKITIPTGFVARENEVHDTYVMRTGSGHQMNLFQRRPLQGTCGRSSIVEMTYSVSSAGEVRLMTERVVFENESQSITCVD